MVSITHSRTVQVAMAFSIALALFIVVLKYIKSNSKILPIALLVVLVPVFTVLGYKAADWTAEGISSLSANTTPAFTQWYENLDNQISELYLTPAGTYEEESDDGDLTDTRDFGSDAKTFTGRTKIWKSVFSVAKNRPMIMLKGTLTNCLMEEPNKYIPFTVGHMHNSFLEVLLFAGIPGFLLICAFCFVLCIHLLKLIFSKDPTVSISIKLLTIPVFGLLLDYMMEAALFTEASLSTNSFFLFAGMALAAYYDVFPEVKLKLKK
jgi:O-antigen ligase